MFRICLLLAIAALPAAAQDWIVMQSPGFELYTNAGERAGRAEIVRLEQFRYVLGRMLRKPDLGITPKPQVFLFKTPKEAAQYAAGGPIQMGRERVAILLAAGEPREEIQRRLTRLLIETNTDRMPAELERGLAALFSTAEITGIKLTLGKPVPPAERDRDWARMHMLAVDPENMGKLPVLFYNLQNGADEEPAYRNAFGRTKAEIEPEVDRYLAAGNFPTIVPGSAPMSVERDFPERRVEPEEIHAKLTAVEQERRAQDEYRKLLAAGDAASLRRAIEIAPKQSEPHYRLAKLESDPKKRVELLKTAVALDRRKAAYWQAMAEAYAELREFGETAKAWRSAEQAAATPEERERMRKGRLDVERQRLDFEDARRKQEAEENARELQALKDAEIAKLRELEARVNQGASPGSADAEIVPWWSGPQPDSKASGTLQQVDCLGKLARLIVRGDDGRIVRLAVRDAGKIAVSGAKEQALGCGRQKPRRIVVEYFKKADARLGTAGDVASIEFP